MEGFSTHVTDMMFGSVRVVTELVMLVKQPRFPHRVVAQRTLVDVRIIAVVFLVQHYHPQHQSQITGLNVLTRQQKATRAQQLLRWPTVSPQ